MKMKLIGTVRETSLSSVLFVEFNQMTPFAAICSAQITEWHIVMVMKLVKTRIAT